MFKNRVNWWGVGASLTIMLGWSATFYLLAWSVDGSTPDELLVLLVLTVIASMGLNGLGLLMRAAAHGNRAFAALDGVGKLVGLLAWSVGISGAVLLAAEGTYIPEETIGAFFGLLVLLSLGFLFWASVFGDPGKPRKRA